MHTSFKKPNDQTLEELRLSFRNGLFSSKLDPIDEVYDPEWQVYSWDEGNEIEPMHPHDALLMELKGMIVVNMTEKHGMRPAHLKLIERKEQEERWANR